MKEVIIGASLEEIMKARLIDMLREFIDIFSWSYQDMPGLDANIVVHRLPLKEELPPVKKKLRRTRPDMSKNIKDEVKKHFDAGLIAVTSYPSRVAVRDQLALLSYIFIGPFYHFLIELHTFILTI